MSSSKEQVFVFGKEADVADKELDAVFSLPVPKVCSAVHAQANFLKVELPKPSEG